jgi:hypothetical protein
VSVKGVVWGIDWPSMDLRGGTDCLNIGFMSLTLRWIQRAGILGCSAARPGSPSKPDPAAIESLTSRSLADNCPTALVCFEAHSLQLKMENLSL